MLTQIHKTFKSKIKVEGWRGFDGIVFEHIIPMTPIDSSELHELILRQHIMKTVLRWNYVK